MKKATNTLLKSGLLLISLFFSLSSFAQDQKALEVALEELRMALINPDEATLLRITSKDLTYGHSSGVIENQAEFVNALKNGPSKFISIQTSDQTIEILDNVALVRHNLLGDVKTGDNIRQLNLGVLLVWKKENEGWKLLARQAFKW